MSKFQPGDILMLCGYRRMGKDTFCERMKENNLSGYSFVSDKLFPTNDLPVRRIAFADSLKREVANMLGVTMDELEQRKDIPLDKPYEFKMVKPDEVITYRHALIDWAMHIRETEPSHWTDVAVHESYSFEHLNIVTDHRFPNEYHVLTNLFPEKVFRLKIHRDNVEIPPLSDVSEHSLDDITPDWFVSA